MAFPFPPSHLLQRTGQVGSTDPERAYDEIGREIRSTIEALLPKPWSWRGARVLDFGCGAGRVLRHFADETDKAEFCGCDIDRPSIAWTQANLDPPFRTFVCNEEPGLPVGDGYFTVIFAISVFTHLTEHATGWLLELHRVMSDDGLLVLTFLGEGMIESLTGEQWEEARIGFNPTRPGTSWDAGGPLTFMSPWWIVEHWGRAFDIVDLRPCTSRTTDGKPLGHGLAVMRKRPGRFLLCDIDRPNPADPREMSALRHNIMQLSRELIRLRRNQ